MFFSTALLERSFRLRFCLDRFDSASALIASTTLSDQGHLPMDFTKVFGFAQTWSYNRNVKSLGINSLLSVAETIISISRRILLVVERSRNEQE